MARPAMPVCSFRKRVARLETCTWIARYSSKPWRKQELVFLDNISAPALPHRDVSSAQAFSMTCTALYVDGSAQPLGRARTERLSSWQSPRRYLHWPYPALALA